MEQKGSCLCGTINFEIEGDFGGFFLCHCSYCRKDTGSAHAANLFFASAKLEWLSGAEQVKTFKLAGTRHSKSFCGQCGSAVPREDPEVGLLAVPAGSLDRPIDVRPNAHIFMGSKAEWDRELEAVPKVDKLPQVASADSE
ncbi:GFA family protein [Microbulbifer sp. ANSA005]|uniref:GFA family protein n=1 Tax=Microbulbifer sp. ANSA005 TaxID=3243362 RepID=UPI004042410A